MFIRNGAVAAMTVASLLCASAAVATTLHPGDHVSVNVYNHPELGATSAPLDSTGHVSVPVAGLVDAANVSPSQLASRIAERLAPYVRKPAVDVQLVAQGQNIFVAGGPGGILPYSPVRTLAGALAQIQQGVGATQATPADPSQIAARQLQYGSIDTKHVVIERDGKDSAPIDAVGLTAGGNSGPALQPDDTIKLSQKPIAVAVKGDVKQPGVAHLDSDEPLSNAVMQVGGTDELTSSVEFLLTRGTTQSVVTTSSPAYRAPAQPVIPFTCRTGRVSASSVKSRNRATYCCRATARY